MSDKSFLTHSLIKAAYKPSRLFLFSGPGGQVMASPSVTAVINEHDLSLWEELSKENFDDRESAMKTISAILQNKNFKCTLSRVGHKLYLTSHSEIE